MRIEDILDYRDNIAQQAFYEGHIVEKTYRSKSGHQLDLIGERIAENFDGPYVTCQIFEDGDPIYYAKVIDITHWGLSLQNGKIVPGYPDTNGRYQEYTVGKFSKEEYAVAYLTTKYHNDPLQPSARAIDPEPFANYGESDMIWKNPKWAEQLWHEDAAVRRQLREEREAHEEIIERVEKDQEMALNIYDEIMDGLYLKHSDIENAGEKARDLNYIAKLYASYYEVDDLVDLQEPYAVGIVQEFAEAFLTEQKDQMDKIVHELQDKIRDREELNYTKDKAAKLYKAINNYTEKHFGYWSIMFTTSSEEKEELEEILDKAGQDLTIDTIESGDKYVDTMNLAKLYVMEDDDIREIITEEDQAKIKKFVDAFYYEDMDYIFEYQNKIETDPEKRKLFDAINDYTEKYYGYMKLTYENETERTDPQESMIRWLANRIERASVIYYSQERNDLETIKDAIRSGNMEKYQVLLKNIANDPEAEPILRKEAEDISKSLVDYDYMKKGRTSENEKLMDISEKIDAVLFAYSPDIYAETYTSRLSGRMAVYDSLDAKDPQQQQESFNYIVSTMRDITADKDISYSLYTSVVGATKDLQDYARDNGLSLQFVPLHQADPTGYQLQNGKYMTVEPENDAWKIQIYEASTFRAKETQIITDARTREEAISNAAFDRQGYGIAKNMDPQEIKEKSAQEFTRRWSIEDKFSNFRSFSKNNQEQSSKARTQ